MSVVKAFRYLLGLAALLVIVWSFVDVGARVVRGQAQARPVELTILHWGDPDEEKIVQRLVDQFEQANPRVKVNRVHANDYDSKLKTMFASGDPPDLFYFKPEAVPEFVEMNLVRPIDDRMSQAEVEAFFPTLLDVYRYDGQSTGAGPLYGLPKDFTTAVMYVNVDLFQRAGVPVPYDGWTWAEYEEAVAKITALSTPNERIYGGMLDLWDATLRNIIWTYGGKFFGTDDQGRPDFTDVRLDEPEAQEAMEMVRRLRFDSKTVFNSTGQAKDGGQEFVMGRIGVVGPIGRWKVPDYRSITDFTFDVVPMPYAVAPASQLFTVAWAISAESEHPEEAAELMKFLVGPEGQAEAAWLGLAIPSLREVAYSDDFLAPGQKPVNAKAFLDAIEFSRIQQYPRQAEFREILNRVQEEALRSGKITPEQAAAEIDRQWRNVLASPLKKDQYAQVNWPAVGGVTLALLTAGVTLLWLKARREKLGAIDRRTERIGWAFIAPWVIGFAVLTAGPMIMSLILAFSRWTAMTPLAEAEWVGGGNFAHLFRYDETFFKSLWVTAYFVVVAVPVTQVLALAVALLMNANVRGISLFRTVYFVPSVVSGVALATLWLKLFNNDYGLINTVVLAPLAWVGIPAPDWFGNDAGWAAVPAFVVMGLWAVGGGMVIYLAGLKNIPTSLYEAATLDGAGFFHKLTAVTLPMLSPLIFFNVVMGLIGSFQIFTQVKVMTNGGPGTDTLFYVLNLYRQAFELHNMGYASAMAWILFVIVLVLTLLVFRGSRGMVHYEGLKA
ncbi:MAG: extracellular solute-binding protein [Phycisphaerae bacterium]